MNIYTSMKIFLSICLGIFILSVKVFGDALVDLDRRLDIVFDPAPAGVEMIPAIEKAVETVGSTDLAEEPKGDYYSMADCIFLTLRDNEIIQSAYVNQIQNQFALRSAEQQFEPQGTITIGANRTDAYIRNGDVTRTWALTGPNLTLNQKLLTGGNFTFTWNNNESWVDQTTNGNNSHSSNAGTNLSLAFTQPLLQGAGLEIGTLPLQNARIAYAQTLLNLKNTLISTITTVITNYRSYVSALASFKIQQAAIKRSKREYEHAKKRMIAGIVSRAAVIETETNLANAELSFEQQENALEQARITLLRSMDVDTSIPLIPDMDLDVKVAYLPTVEECLEIAFANSPQYLGQLLNVRTAELGLMQAKNNLLWNLNFTSSITASSSSGPSSLQRANDSAWSLRNKQLNAGLSLTIPVNNISMDGQYLSARITMRSARIQLRELEETMKANFQTTLIGIKSQMRQVELAERATKLSKQQYNGAQLNYAAGKTSAFELTSRQNDLTSTETQELSAKINLLNSLTNLDQQLGTTLLTWKVDINPRAVESPRFVNKFYEQIASRVIKK